MDLSKMLPPVFQKTLLREKHNLQSISLIKKLCPEYIMNIKDLIRQKSNFKMDKGFEQALH